MKRILTGIQSTGTPHLGNILGAMGPAIDMANDKGNEAFLFIADLHSLTSIRDGETRRNNTFQVATAWLAFGLDTENNLLYRQSDVTEVCELTWYLSCFAPYSMLKKAHSFKDKADKAEEVNTGLFTYPVLMAADILLYEADVVPVGKDQKQHLEMTRDMAQKVNHTYGKELLKVPEPRIDEKVMTVPGIDGQKMSKSYNNYINIFESDKKLRKQVMQVVTDSKGLEEPKDPDSCNVFKLYEYVATPEEVAEMRKNYENGGYGYGHAKQALFDKITETFGPQREKYNELMNDPNKVEEELHKGAERARNVASKVLTGLRKEIGF